MAVLHVFNNAVTKGPTFEALLRLKEAETHYIGKYSCWAGNMLVHWLKAVSDAVLLNILAAEANT